MKRRIAAMLLLTGLLFSACGGRAETELRLTIDPDRMAEINGGVFEGWGTSLCWWANRVGYSINMAKQAAAAICDPVKGLGLNILRYNIGGGDDPAHSHITRTDSMMQGFWKDPQYQEETHAYSWEYDWTRDANQRRVLAQCLKVYGDGMLVEAFSNSPPYFMTVSGCSSGSAIASENNLKSDAYDAFAQYLADVAEHFASEWGIRFQSISPMNEPFTNYWSAYSPKQEGCHFDIGASQSRLLTALAAQLQEKGLGDILISGTDETSIDTQIRAINRLSPDARNVIGRIDTHTYGGSQRYKLRELALSEGKNLWMSEADGGDTLGINAGEMGAALWLAQRIADDLNGLTPSAWIIWQVIDSHISSNGYLGRKDTGMVNVDGGYWGTAVMDHDKQELILTKKYYAFGQFTRYIRPGSRLIEMDGPAVAALDENVNRLVAVVINQEGTKRDLTLKLSGFADAFPDGCAVRMIRTSGSMETGENWKELPSSSVSGGCVTASLIPHSITTFVIEGNTGK